MSNREIVLRLDERWYKALNRHLKNETLEEHMEDVLDEAGWITGRPTDSAYCFTSEAIIFMPRFFGVSGLV